MPNPRQKPKQGSRQLKDTDANKLKIPTPINIDETIILSVNQPGSKSRL